MLPGVVALGSEYVPKDYWRSVAEEVEKYNDEWLKIGMVGNDTWFNKYNRDRAEKLIFEIIPKRKFNNILDAGCGVGQWSLLLSIRLNAQVIGIDLIPKMIEMAEKRAKVFEIQNADFCVMNLANQGFKNYSFDLVICVTVLQHIVNEELWRRSIEELVRVTKPNGFIVIYEIAPAHFLGKKKEFDYYIHLESEYVNEFKRHGVLLKEKKGVENIGSHNLIKLGMKLLNVYAWKVDKKKPDFYSKDFSGYKPKALYLPCIFLITLAKIIDSFDKIFSFLGQKAFTKIFLFQKGLG
jgi:ubiquinone/menaquinone biosynthesis C-methylase UbiE